MSPQMYDTSTRQLTPELPRCPKGSRKKEIGGGEVFINCKIKGLRTKLEDIQEEYDGFEVVQKPHDADLTTPNEEVISCQSEVETSSSERMDGVETHGENYGRMNEPVFEDYEHEKKVFEDVQLGHLKLEDLLELESDGVDKTIENIRQVQGFPFVPFVFKALTSTRLCSNSSASQCPTGLHNYPQLPYFREPPRSPPSIENKVPEVETIYYEAEMRDGEAYLSLDTIYGKWRVKRPSRLRRCYTRV